MPKEPERPPWWLLGLDSEEFGAALDDLRLVMIGAGFHVQRRHRNEATLRAYLGPGVKYPLLNPRLNETLEITVLSKGGHPGIDRRLAKFRGSRDCSYVEIDRAERWDQGFVYHGWFFVPLSFVRRAGALEVDMAALAPPLRRIRRIFGETG